METMNYITHTCIVLYAFMFPKQARTIIHADPMQPSSYFEGAFGNHPSRGHVSCIMAINTLDLTHIMTMEYKVCSNGRITAQLKPLQQPPLLLNP